MEETIDGEFQDTPSFDEETIQEPEIETTDSEVDVEALKQQAEKAQRFADKTDAENKRLAKQIRDLQSGTTDTSTNNDQSIPDDRFERLDLKTDGYNSDEIEVLMQNGGRSALDNPIVMAGIEAIRAKNKSLNATPSGTGKSPVYQKHTERDLKKMSLEDLEKIVPQD